ncbi:MAG: hypothetical protein Q8P32_03695 [Candidatus Komeilibacteria bacterium]|nr:hypothetical protein [Candidatus Komeilibacteria bacterium]
MWSEEWQETIHQDTPWRVIASTLRRICEQIPSEPDTTLEINFGRAKKGPNEFYKVNKIYASYFLRFIPLEERETVLSICLPLDLYDHELYFSVNETIVDIVISVFGCEEFRAFAKEHHLTVMINQLTVFVRGTHRPIGAD